jgi:hypothetical protein
VMKGEPEKGFESSDERANSDEDRLSFQRRQSLGSSL